jgi:crotonobetainyl-CoA:carnitine CoA-transferase CaiB-like acyl-CoA transferase
MQAFSGLAPREGPTYSTVQASTHATSQAAITGIFAALFARERIGFGQYVETSLLQGLLPYDLAGLTLQSLIEKEMTILSKEAMRKLKKKKIKKTTK